MTDIEQRRARPGDHGRFLAEAVAADTDDCILWPYGRSQWTASGGRYGAVTGGTAHNAALRLAAGDPPPGKDRACHTCDVPLCVNPRHLYWGDASTNLTDALERGQFVPWDRRGRAPGQILTAEQVATIKRTLADTPRTPSGRFPRGTFPPIADEYGVDPTTIAKIASGKNWGHVDPA